MDAFSQNVDYVLCFNSLLKASRERSFEEFLSFHGDDTEIVQLSAGRFSAKILTTSIGRVFIGLECCNQAIEREKRCDADALTFHLCADERSSGLSYTGITRETDWVFVQPPHAGGILISPAKSVQLTVQVSYKLFLDHLSSMPEIANWLTCLTSNGEFLKSSLIADRLRDIGRMAMALSKHEVQMNNPEQIERNLVLCLISGLALQWLPKQAFSTYPKTPALKRFQTTRRMLLEKHEEFHERNLCAFSRLGSRRSIEKSFSQLIDMGPATYGRVLRLNRARRKIRNRSFSGRSIGDIAAEEGFWDWSRFASYYRKQFGELPSETRSSPARLKACA